MSTKTPMPGVATRTLHERIGGAPAVEKVVDILYRRLLADARVRPFYDRVDMRRLARKQRAFLTHILGGSDRYAGQVGAGLASAHRKVVAEGLDDTHFDIVCEHVAGALREIDAPEDAIGETIEALQGTREDVLGRSAVAAEAPPASPPEPSIAKRLLGFTYGVICYAIFFATFLYAIGWVGGILVPNPLDGPPVAGFWPSLLINVALLGVFAVQHSVMARPAFKRWLTRFVPRPLERSTYVLLSSAALILLFWQWRPLGGVIWDIQSPAGQAAMYAIFATGWALVLISTFLINHFDLFGLRQVWLYLRGRKYTPLAFRTPTLYRMVRHPLYLGWLLAFWATPTMTGAHLLFAAVTTAYIFVAIQLEERDLVDAHGPDYAEYRRRVPMIIPLLRRKPRAVAAPQTA